MSTPDHQFVQRALSALSAAEAGPSPSDLADAPMMHLWMPLVTPRGGPTLHGYVTGHPDFWVGSVRTSWLIALDRDAGWARTLGRFYLLDPPLASAGTHVFDRDPTPAEAEAGIRRFDCPGYRPVTDPEVLEAMLAEHARRFRQLAAEGEAS